MISEHLQIAKDLRDESMLYPELLEVQYKLEAYINAIENIIKQKACPHTKTDSVPVYLPLAEIQLITCQQCGKTWNEL